MYCVWSKRVAIPSAVCVDVRWPSYKGGKITAAEKVVLWSRRWGLGRCLFLSRCELVALSNCQIKLLEPPPTRMEKIGIGKDYAMPHRRRRVWDKKRVPHTCNNRARSSNHNSLGLGGYFSAREKFCFLMCMLWLPNLIVRGEFNCCFVRTIWRNFLIESNAAGILVWDWIRGVQNISTASKSNYPINYSTQCSISDERFGFHSVCHQLLTTFWALV